MGRIKRPLGALALFTAILVLTATAAQAGVITDHWVYQAGDTVYISGDGMTPGETVGVDVSYPDASLAQHHDVAADDQGNFSDTYVIQSTDPAGIYTVTATGQTSGATFTTTFDPAVPGCSVGTPTFTSNTTGTSLTVNWTSNCFSPPSDSGDVYNVYYRTPAGSGSYTLYGHVDWELDPGPGANDPRSYHLDITGLTCGLSYEFYVDAFRPSNNQDSPSNPASVTTAACPETPTVSTLVKDADGNTIASIDAGSPVHDRIEVTTSNNDIPAGSTVSLTLWKGPFSTSGDCTTGASSETVTVGSPTATTSKDWVWNSNDVTKNSAADYAFQASFTSGNTSSVTSQTGDCEFFSVDAVNPSMGTTIHNAADDTSGTSFPLATSVYDTATLTSSNGTPEGKVTFNLYSGGTCASHPSSSLLAGPDQEDLVTGSANSPDSGALHAGNYYYLVTYASGDTGKWNDITTPTCEDLTITAVDPTVTTVINKTGDTTTNYDANADGTKSVALGSTANDVASVSGSSVSGFAPTGSVTITFYKGGSCDPGTANVNVVTTDSNVALVGGSASSSTTAALHAGSYSYLAHYNGSGDYNAKDASCERLVVNKADTSIATTIKDKDGNTVGSYVTTGQLPVHDTSSVSSTNTSGFSFNGTNNLTYTFYTNGTCTPSGSSETFNYPHDSSTHNPGVGSYCFKAQYLGNSDYNGSISPIEPFTVVPPSSVTDSSLCPFDTDTSSAGSQFNLIYTPDVNAPTFKLNASNPGQFYDNGFYVGPGNVDVTFTLPLPFVTQGAVPIHVYSGVSFGTGGCLIPGTEIANSNQQITLTSTRTVTVHVPALTGGFAYINIHMDYGYKGYDNCTKNATTLSAGCTTPAGVTINNNSSYTFSSSIGPDVTVYSENIFKKDPGIGGLVTVGGNPVVGAAVKIYDGSNKLLATVYTDSDGWYMWAYKYTGKAATFNVTYVKTQTVTLKSNGYLIVNFQS